MSKTDKTTDTFNITGIIEIDPDKIDYERTEQEAVKALEFKAGVTVKMLDGWMRDSQQGWSDCEAENEKLGEQVAQNREDVLRLYAIVRHLVKHIDTTWAEGHWPLSLPQHPVVANARRVMDGGDLSVTYEEFVKGGKG